MLATGYNDGQLRLLTLPIQLGPWRMSGFRLAVGGNYLAKAGEEASFGLVWASAKLVSRGLGVKS